MLVLLLLLFTELDLMVGGRRDTTSLLASLFLVAGVVVPLPVVVLGMVLRLSSPPVSTLILATVVVVVAVVGDGGIKGRARPLLPLPPIVVLRLLFISLNEMLIYSMKFPQ